ncbi:MAG: hypothetical protein HUU20_12795 [Pirellulales bacterium]|nr:hypothetical protein [Pirellulales bacterium]
MKRSAGLFAIAPFFLLAWSTAAPALAQSEATTEAFAREVERVLPEEKPYEYHKRLSEGPVHTPRRDAEARTQPGEMELPRQGWKLVCRRQGSQILDNAVRDFQDYLEKSMQVRVELDARDSLEGWAALDRSIVVGTREQLPGCGATLKAAKDYEIVATPQRLVVCGYDERGAMYGLYNLEARMNLREGPFLPADLKTVRHSLYDVRTVMSWMGWMEWPDMLLSHLAHDGFDGIFASAFANPNGDRTTVETSTDFYARLIHGIRRQDPARVQDLIRRASRFGIKVYAPVIYQYQGTPESEAELRRLVRDLVRQFPDIRGYILLTEGFWYKKWGGGHGASREYLEDWARNWSRAVGIVAEECHRVDKTIEILPWEYNIDFRPQNVDVKRYFVRQLPADTIPLLTWENGKSFEIDGLQGHLCDYSISQVGPAEVTAAQIEEAHGRGMKVYTNGDTFVCGAQLQTVPYHPFPYQWHERYRAMEKHGIKGTLESWSTGYTPSFQTELRAWFCWSDPPPLEDLLAAMAARRFGSGGKDMVLSAWRLLSEGIRLLPDTGPNMGTSNAIGNPLFFQEPPVRTATFHHSWTDHEAWMGYLGGRINPYWPFTLSRLVFCPDFTNQTNRAEGYARAVSGIESAGQTKILPVFLKYLRLAADRMGEGLVPYRAAALAAPPPKRADALREVIVAEQIQRMLLSDHAILEFEDLRLQLAAEQERTKAAALLDRMETIVREEIARTELSLLAATRDSRLGFQFECDYVYTPFCLREKLESLRETLEQLADCRKTDKP